jgi:integrase
MRSWQRDQQPECTLTPLPTCPNKWDHLREWIGETVTLPAALTKNRREHTFPIGNLAREVINSRPRLSELVFPGIDPDKPWNGWGKAKRQLDSRTDIAAWRIHDLRRTFATIVSLRVV